MAIREDSLWQKDARCVEFPEVDFFPDISIIKAVRNAKQVCSSCLVRQDCLDSAFDNDMADGIWGGLTTPERRKMRPFRRLQSINGTVSVDLKPISTSPKSFSLRVP